MGRAIGGSGSFLLLTHDAESDAESNDYEADPLLWRIFPIEHDDGHDGSGDERFLALLYDLDWWRGANSLDGAT